MELPPGAKSSTVSSSGPRESTGDRTSISDNRLCNSNRALQPPEIAAAQPMPCDRLRRPVRQCVRPRGWPTEIRTGWYRRDLLRDKRLGKDRPRKFPEPASRAYGSGVGTPCMRRSLHEPCTPPPLRRRSLPFGG